MEYVTKSQKQQASQFRELFQRAIQPYAHLPLFLSGGVDSSTNLAGILSLGMKPPHCYTFRIGDRDSVDAHIARKMCLHFQVPHTVISIPRTEETLLTDIRRVLQITGKAIKTHVQCCQPCIYLANAARGDGYSEVTCATSADNLWGTMRNIAAYVKKNGEEWCREQRRIATTWVDYSDTSMKKTTLAYGITMLDPWRDTSIVTLLLACNYADIHSPMLKGLAIRAFPEFWTQGHWYRPNSSLQVNSGIREWHDTLLKSQYNRTNAKVVVVIYRQMLKELYLDVEANKE